MSAEAGGMVAGQVEMVNIEVDGVPLQAPKGSMIIEATDKAGISIPRFCYHPKLSIAASCRMCLVDVEKAPKPLPACATPVMEGMKIYTQSRRAIDAQHGVMEFLLINHPLDCPICDQGGECELQDLAMGYGRSVSRFSERKRVVKDKNVGALVQTDMTRCIHCTRCVRFLEEIAGSSEMGGSGRGDRLEIGTCIENSIDSELSGNIIDLCPVGALTNKPFRFSARAWELVARPSIGVHDGVGSKLYHHVKNGRILRSVPRDDEATNETWLTDRDRYSHFGLYAQDRVTQPLVKNAGQWQAASWDEAMRAALGILRPVADRQPAQLAALMSPGAATEEFFLAQRLVRALGSSDIDHRLREQDFSDDQSRPLAPLFGMKIAAMDRADSVLLLGCNPRHEAPILGHRLREAWRRGAALMAINPLQWEFVFATEPNIVVAPQFMLAELLGVAAALSASSGKPLPGPYAALAGSVAIEPRHRAIAERLSAARRGLVLVGQSAMSHHQAGALRQLAGWIAQTSACALNLLPHGLNPVGAWLAGAVPHRGPAGSRTSAGLTREALLNSAGKTWLLWDVEPEFDIDNPAAAMAGLQAADKVLAVSVFASEGLKQVADVILPLAPAAESAGSVVNFDGDVINFAAAGQVQGQARPGWKILHRLGTELGLEGFSQVDLPALQDEMKAAIFAANDGAGDAQQPVAPVAAGDGLYRVGEVPMYSADALCRRAAALQQTAHASNDFVGLNPADAARIGLAEGSTAGVRQGEALVKLPVRVSARVPVGAAWLRSATGVACQLGAATGPIQVEVA